jgi:hypothetical protein
VKAIPTGTHEPDEPGLEAGCSLFTHYGSWNGNGRPETQKAFEFQSSIMYDVKMLLAFEPSTSGQ